MTSEIDKISFTENTRANEVERGIAALRSGEGVSIYSSIVGDTEEARIANFNAISDSVPIADHLGEVLNVENVVIQSVDMVNEQTGEITAQPRIILITAEGVNYHAISKGLFTSVRNIFALIGEPHTWSKPLGIIVSEQRGSNGFRYMTARVNPPAKK